MKTLRQFLECKEKNSKIQLEQVNFMAKAVGVGFIIPIDYLTYDASQRRTLNQKVDIIITQFQIQFGLDEEF